MTHDSWNFYEINKFVIENITCMTQIWLDQCAFEVGTGSYFLRGLNRTGLWWETDPSWSVEFERVLQSEERIFLHHKTVFWKWIILSLKISYVWHKCVLEVPTGSYFFKTSQENRIEVKNWWLVVSGVWACRAVGCGTGFFSPALCPAFSVFNCLEKVWQQEGEAELLSTGTSLALVRQQGPPERSSSFGLWTNPSP